VPLFQLIKKFKPHLLTVAYDPEGTGPDTHYKVLQIVAEVVKMMQNERYMNPNDDMPVPFIWGYRNVWHRFDWHDANMYFPVDSKLMEDMNDTFMSCYVTQRKASFPSPYFNGPFSKWAEDIAHTQLEQFKTIVGPQYISSFPDRRLKDACGMILLKHMTASEFVQGAAELKARLGLQ